MNRPSKFPAALAPLSSDTGAAVSPLAAAPTDRERALRDRVELIDGALYLKSSGKPISLRADKDGYLTFTLVWGGKTRYFAAARAIWFLHYGEWPKGEIDHINGRRDDNRIGNLQDVSRAENQRLRLERKPFQSGKGVYFQPGQNTWRAEIYVGGVCHHLGTHKTQEDALAARLEAEARFQPPVPVAPTFGDPPNFIELGYGTGPRCIKCRRNVSGCQCDAPEPEAEYFKPGLNREPRDGSVWLRAEEAAVRSSFGMPGVGA